MKGRRSSERSSRRSKCRRERKSSRWSMTKLWRQAKLLDREQLEMKAEVDGGGDGGIEGSRI